MKIDIDTGKLKMKIEGASDRALALMGEEILADCNEFVKVDTGLLMASSLTHSDPGKLELTWNTPYAARQYWAIPTANTDKNPNATWRWCEAAAQKHMDDWIRQAEVLIRRGL